MARFKVEINMDNAAFEDSPYELADILQGLSEVLRDTYPFVWTGNLRDSNGNTVGKATASGVQAVTDD